MSKLTIYGSLLCPDTQEALKLLDKKRIEYDFKNISDELVNLKAFLAIRDTNDKFNAVREKGGIGIPCFVLKNGELSFDVNDVL